jgi:hypothetical protein
MQGFRATSICLSLENSQDEKLDALFDISRMNPVAESAEFAYKVRRFRYQLVIQHWKRIIFLPSGNKLGPD